MVRCENVEALHSQVVILLQGRNAKKPIAICVAEIEEIYSWANVTVSRQVIEELLPGQVRRPVCST